MTRHLAELGALLLCFAVGVGLLAAFFVGLAWIWRSPDSAIEDEYRRVESAAWADAEAESMAELKAGNSLLFSHVDDVVAHLAYMSSRHPYNWATREPMVWTVPRV